MFQNKWKWRSILLASELELWKSRDHNKAIQRSGHNNVLWLWFVAAEDTFYEILPKSGQVIGPVAPTIVT